MSDQCCSTSSNKSEENQPTGSSSCCSGGGASGQERVADQPMDESAAGQQVFSIAGMDCGNCAKSIENHFAAHPAVSSVSVNFSSGKMRIAHSSSSDDIMNELSKIGYKGALQSKGRTAAEPGSTNHYGLVAFSGLLILVGYVGSKTALPAIAITLLYAAAMLLSGFKPLKGAFYSIKSRSLDMNVLMSAAAIGAAVIGEWLEGATVVWLFALGNVLQNRSMEQTRKSIRNLMDSAPPEAWVKSERGLIQKAVEEVLVGETIVVKPGDKIPLDGEILQGESSINQSSITGESIPVDKTTGDFVYAGTLNENGVLEIKVTKLAEDTTLSKIIHLVEEAQEQKAPTEAFIDKFASIYTPVVFVLAIATMVLPPLVGWGSFGEWFYKGLELLVVACPCALVISTPVAIVSAIGSAARNGVLIKGGTFLEMAGTIGAIAFDKTGTLTEGKPKVEKVMSFGVSEEELLSIALTLEEPSNHPIAKAIVSYGREHHITSKSGSMFKNQAGKGVHAVIEGETYYAGNAKWFEEMNVSTEEIKKHDEGKTTVIIGTATRVIGLILVADQLRESTITALHELKKAGVTQTVMLTGDNENTAKRIAENVKISRVFAELLPQDKAAAIQQLQKEGLKVAMVGDGINDAPALATANLGIAMGGAGTDTAMETADLVLMADNLEKLPYTIHLSRKALSIIKQNIWFSVVVKASALLLIFPGVLTLWLAVLSDTGAALLVILNALRLYKK